MGHILSIRFWMSSEEPYLAGSTASEAQDSGKKWQRPQTVSAHRRFDLKLTVKKSQVGISASRACSGLQDRLRSEAVCIQAHRVLFGLRLSLSKPVSSSGELGASCGVYACVCDTYIHTFHACVSRWLTQH